MLAQQREFFPQLVFHLDAVQVRRNRQTLDHIFAKENAMVLLHIDQLNRKHVNRAFDLVPGHEQGRRLLLRIPPFHGRGKSLQCRE